jgi:hypothetical protein
VGLSGAIPDLKDWSEPAMDRGILEFVSLFSGIVFKYGGRIVHGCHPTFVPIILRQARLQAGSRLRKPVTLIMSDLWAQDLSNEDIQSMIDIAEFVVTRRIGDGGPENTETRNRSLTAMRRVLISAQNVMVAVGGKMHSGDGRVPGVAEEMKFAEEKRIPQFLVAGLGGFAHKLAKDLAPTSLHNALSPSENTNLFGTTDVSACVNLLFEHFVRSKDLANSVLQPIKWNPGLGLIVDHRDGTIQTQSTQYILRSFAI